MSSLLSRRSALTWLLGSAAAALLPPTVRADPDPFDQSGVPLEEEPRDGKLAKIVLVAGKPSHKPGEHEFFAGCAVLRKLLAQVPGVFPVVVRDGWPQKKQTFESAKAVVFFMDGGGDQTTIQGDHLAAVQKLADSGVGLVHLHAVIDYPKDLGERARGWLGGCYEPGVSKRAHWVSEFRTFPDHPSTRGVRPFKIDDGWLYNLRFVPGMKGVVPLLRTWPPSAKAPAADAAETIVSWAYEGPAGGRSFVFTGCHLHQSWAEEGYRRFLVNGILWSGGIDVPKEGAPVELEPADLKRYLDRKEAKK